MIDKVQKIREEVQKIARSINPYIPDEEGKNSEYESGRFAMVTQIMQIIDSMQEEPVSGLGNGDMPVERWKQAVKAASNQRSYRSSKGLTETRDDYFVDGVQWADEHPKEEPVSEDLEEAADKYESEQQEKYKDRDNHDFDNYRDGFVDGLTHTYEAFMSGAKWQKAKDESITEDLGEYINELSKQFPEVSFAKVCKIATRTAKWLMLNSKLEED